MAVPRIGTTGWMDDDWHEGFCAGAPRARRLAHCGERFSAREPSTTCDRVQQRRAFGHWQDAVPADLRFAVQAHRALTHVRQLRDPVEPIRCDQERAEVLDGLGQGGPR